MTPYAAVMSPDPGLDPSAFRPGDGRAQPATPGAARRVRMRLGSRRAGRVLQRMSGRPNLLKRLVDVVGSFLLLLMLGPMFVAVAVLIKLTDGGPVLYWQRRVGLNGREFAFPKFRSMVPGADRLVRMLATRNQHGDKGVTFKMKDDPRITWIGKIIRRGSIDELPQLWCVLKGDMSLVGPRPSLPREVAKYTPRDRLRLGVTPGLTCIWQVSGRGDIPFPQQVEMDIDYIRRRNVWFDLKLIFLTVPAVLKGKGAY